MQCMANVYSIAWLVYLSLLCGLCPVLPAKNRSVTPDDFMLLSRYRNYVANHLSNRSCTHDYPLTKLNSIVFDFRVWEKEQDLANNVANFLTSMWRYKNSKNFSLVENELTMYSLVRSNILSSHLVYGSVICFEDHGFMKRKRFCPYAFRDKTAKNRVRVFDLGAKHDYLNKTPEFVWWEIGRKKGLENKLKSDIEYYDTNLMHVNASDLRQSDRFFNVTGRFITSNDTVWTPPYYDCFGGETWVLTYLAPFYDGLNRFLGVVSIDIELDSIEVDQCDFPETKTIQEAKEKWKNKLPLSLYGTHRCRHKSTKCVHVPGGGFANGNYRCVCKKGYYFPTKFNATGIESFKGSEIEHAYTYNKTFYNSMFYCLPCGEGCEECVDDTPCMFTRNIPLRIALLTLNETVKALAIVLAIYIFVFRQRKIIKASSPVFMEIIALGIILMYFEISFGYLETSVAVCIAKSWLYHVGFILAFGSLLLKTWRIVVIFRLRSAKMIELTDFNLLKYLAAMVTAVLIYLMIWTWTNTPAEETIDEQSGSKYRQCVHGWFSNAIVIGEILFLSWGAWLCIRVRNAPSAYNESKYIAWCIYNSVFIMVLVTLLRYLFRKNIQNPDVSYVVDFLSTHVVATMMLVFLFISKIFLLKKHPPKTAVPSSVSMSHTDRRKSPFRLTRFVDGTFEPEIDEERSVHSFEMEIVALREEIRSLNAQLAVHESKQARCDRRKESGPDNNDRSLLNNGLQNTSLQKESKMTSSNDTRTPGRHRSMARSSISGDSNVYTPGENRGSLIENIKKSGTTNSDATYLAVPLKRSISDEGITLISRSSTESQE